MSCTVIDFVSLKFVYFKVFVPRTNGICLLSLLLVLPYCPSETLKVVTETSSGLLLPSAHSSNHHKICGHAVQAEFKKLFDWWIVSRKMVDGVATIQTSVCFQFLRLARSTSASCIILNQSEPDFKGSTVTTVIGLGDVAGIHGSGRLRYMQHLYTI